MERLTVNKLGNLLIKEADGEYRSPCYGCENINFCKPEKERVCRSYKALDKLKEYEDLEEQGLLLKFPCKVGDTVYTNTIMLGWNLRKKDRPYKLNVVFIGTNGTKSFMNVAYKNGHMFQFDFSDIGKTVFLTKAEAEEALKNMTAAAGTKEK